MRNQAAYAPAVLAVILLLARAAHAVAGRRVAAPLRYPSVNSPAVYVVHYRVAFVLAELLERAGVSSSPAAFTAVVVASFSSGVLAVEAGSRSRSAR